MGAYPGREFRAKEIINYVRNGRTLTAKARQSMHVAVFRVLRQLEESGSVDIERAENGHSSIYRWKTITSESTQP
jgi:hypothetical protein